MASKKDILGFVHAGRKIRRPPLVGMQFLHERAVGAPDIFRARAALDAKDLIGLLLSHFAGTRRAALPRCRITLRAFTPGGIAAVKISDK